MAKQGRGFGEQEVTFISQNEVLWLDWPYECIPELNLGGPVGFYRFYSDRGDCFVDCRQERAVF